MATKVTCFSIKPFDRDAFEDCLKSSGLNESFEFTYQEVLLTPETAALAKGSQCVVAFVNDSCSKEVLEILAGYGIKLLAMRCAGFDKVDLKAATQLGMSVVRVPAYSPYAVAEHAASLLMAVNRKLYIARDRNRSGNFQLDGLVGFDIYGKTIGVVGTGKIGQCFIDIALGFGAKVLCYDVYKVPKYENMENVRYVDVETVFKESDVISLHVPLLPATHHLVNSKTLSLMKPHAILVNTSRGGLVDAKALVDALVNKQIGGAAMDVYEHESEYFFKDCSKDPIKDDVLARMMNLPNFLLTSHQAYLTKEALNNIASTTLLNLREYFIDHKSMDGLTNYVPQPQ